MIYTENYISDLTNAQKNVKNINVLNNSKILITGAGGLICSAIVDFLLQINKTNNSNISVYCAARNYEKIEKRFLDKVSDSGFNFIKYDALEPINSEIDFDYIIHGASNANPSLYVEQPVETIMANFLGLKNILDYSKKHNTKKVLYISSSEVYGKKTSEQPYNENEYGFLDILNPRACYPSSKRASETLCVAYLKQYEVESVIVRPGHIYGPTMTDSDTRASSQFPKDVLNGKDIVMKSLGTQLRSYCYVIDCVSAIMTVLLNGKSGEAYNISNKHSVVTIRELAECFALVGGKKVIFDIPTDAEKAGYNLMDNSSLTSDKLESIGWQGEFDLRRGVEATLDAARE